ncbi:MAG: cytochrome c1 [Pseudomonadota bacterium]
MLKTVALGTLALLLGGTAALEAAEQVTPIQRSWTHDGLFGTFDRSAAQRGFQVYREVCAGCHGLEYVAFRNLQQLGFTEDEVGALASEYLIVDGPNDEGEMFEREGRPADRFPPPYENDEMGRFLNGGALPPDLSLITKARADGTNYLFSLLMGYEEPPPGEEGLEGLYYNAYFPNHWIAMPPPLFDDAVEYADGSSASMEQMSSDLAVFLTWAAEPTLEERKQMGLKVMLFLIILTALLYATKRKIWADVH